MIDFNVCKWVVWGFRNAYCTHSHIHEGFYRTLKSMGKDVEWLDQADDISKKDFSNTFFITNHSCVGDGPGVYWPSQLVRRSRMPLRNDCFYIIHGLNGDPAVREVIKNYPYMSWNVFHDFSHVYGMQGGTWRPDVPLTERIILDEDTPFYPRERHMDFRWATDLLPEEIQKNKPTKVFRDTSDVIHYIGTLWFVNQTEIAAFKRACDENKIRFEMSGAGQNGIVTREDNEKLVKDSYMAPAISGSHHLTEGYAPCRIFKNISYGQYGITNSARVQKIFGGKLIFNPDPYKLFYEARERLQSTTLDDLYKLMDEVAAKHTYVNRINNILTAARLLC